MIISVVAELGFPRLAIHGDYVLQRSFVLSRKALAKTSMRRTRSRLSKSPSLASRLMAQSYSLFKKKKFHFCTLFLLCNLNIFRLCGCFYLISGCHIRKWSEKRTCKSENSKWLKCGGKSACVIFCHSCCLKCYSLHNGTLELH